MTNEGQNAGARRGPLVPSLGVSAVSSPLEVGADRAPKVAEELAELLSEQGYEVFRFEPLDSADKSTEVGRKLSELHVDAVAIASASWFEDYLAIDLLEECRVPALLWSLPGIETGALCGTQQLTALLKRLGWAYHCVFGHLNDADCLKSAKAFLRACALKSRLRRARIGVGGHRLGGMTDAAVNEIALKAAVGPRVVPLDLPQLLRRADEIPDKQVRPAWEEIVRRSGRCNVGGDVGLDSIRMHAAIRELVEQESLDAIAIGCFPRLTGRVCLPASLLADEGIPLACEGDVSGAVGQLMLTLLTEKPTLNTDWLEPIENGTVVFSHCGSGSFGLAERRDDISLDPVRLTAQGVCALFTAKPGPVTLLNLMPSGDGYRCALLSGEAISTGMVFPGNPVCVRFAQSAEDLVEWIHAEGIGHHWMIGYGHVRAEIRAWASVAGEKLQLIEPPEHRLPA